MYMSTCVFLFTLSTYIFFYSGMLVIIFCNFFEPVQASLAANTFAIQGHAEVKSKCYQIINKCVLFINLEVSTKKIFSRDLKSDPRQRDAFEPNWKYFLSADRPERWITYLFFIFIIKNLHCKMAAPTWDWNWIVF